MAKQTKIIATISDKRCEVDFIQALFNEGLNVVRLNSAHLSKDGFDKIIGNVRAVSDEIAILMDTKGPEIRTTIADEPLSIKSGDIIKIYGDPNRKTESGTIAVSYPHFVREIALGSDILFDDGEIEVQVIEKRDDYLLCEAHNDGILGSRKSVNVPSARINMPSLTDKDRANILYAIENNIDFIAHSFVRSKQDILDIQEILDQHKSSIKIIAKIENQEGVDNIDEILQAAYGVMIARGDLGIEIAQEKIPGIQRLLIRKCVLAQKPVIVATQMLHSMIQNPRPTRAEVTDVANAIFYRTDALMLSGETAYGKYPIESVHTMSKIAEEAEKGKLSDNDIKIPHSTNERDITSFLARQAVESQHVLETKAILTASYTGRTVRFLAAYRGVNPIYAMCPTKPLVRQLALSYGVIPVYQVGDGHVRDYYLKALHNLVDRGLISVTDKVVYLSSNDRNGVSGTTFLEINLVSHIFNNENK